MKNDQGDLHRKISRKQFNQSSVLFLVDLLTERNLTTIAQNNHSYHIRSAHRSFCPLYLRGLCCWSNVLTKCVYRGHACAPKSCHNMGICTVFRLVNATARVCSN